VILTWADPGGPFPFFEDHSLAGGLQS
jgi:hypothetical protein